LDEDEGNLYLRESLSQIGFLLEKGDLTEEQAFTVFFNLPISKALLVAELETQLPEGCILADYDNNECVEEDADITKVR
jgi:hypothetical protein